MYNYNISLQEEERVHTRVKFESVLEIYEIFLCLAKYRILCMYFICRR